MLAVEAFGDGLGSVTLAERQDPAAPGPKDVVLDMLAMTINPADLLMIEGRYGVRPKPPFIPGAEGVARVRAAGAEARGLAPGDLVIPFAGACWAEAMTTRAGGVVKLPPDVDLDQAAMLKANPATALAMLSDIVALEPGDWVVQNAANSAVGVNVIKIAQKLGLRTLNIVRRDAAADALRALGADAVVVDAACGLGDGLAMLGGARPKLGFDAVGGPATNAIALALADGGTIANYGLLSGEPCEVGPDHLVFRDIRLRGFWLASWFQTATKEVIAARYAQLAAWLREGAIGAPVTARYPISQAAQALAHAAKAGRDGKVLLVTDAYDRQRRDD